MDEQGSSTATGGSQAVSREEFQRLFSTIADKKGQLTNLKHDLSQERSEADERLVKHLKANKKTVFKKKGNERQYAFNEEVYKTIHVAQQSLESTPPNVERVWQSLQEGESLIKKRQKLMKVADRLEHGWATVEEYVTDELAENSDDEKRLFKAEARAGRKLKASSESKVKKPSGKGGYGNNSVWKLNWNSLRPQVPMAAVARHLKGRELAQAQIVRAQPPVVGPCFQCGKLGHLRKACPLLNNI